METDEEHYLNATREVADVTRNEALWAKAMALAEGSAEKAKYIYIKLRVKQLAESRRDVKGANQQTLPNSRGPEKGHLLLKVDHSFATYDKGFSYNGRFYSYAGVTSVTYSGFIGQFNGAHVGSTASLSLEHEDCGYISLNAEAWVFRGRRFKDIGRAASILSQKTYDQRLRKYLTRLETAGFFSIPKVALRRGGKEIDQWEVRVYANGDVLEHDQRLNLRRAYANRSLRIGYDFGFGLDRSSDPYEVLVSEAGTAMWNKKIVFDISTDYDVLHTLLRSLAGVEQ